MKVKRIVKPPFPAGTFHRNSSPFLKKSRHNNSRAWIKNIAEHRIYNFPERIAHIYRNSMGQFMRKSSKKRLRKNSHTFIRNSIKKNNMIVVSVGKISVVSVSVRSNYNRHAEVRLFSVRCTDFFINRIGFVKKFPG